MSDDPQEGYDLETCAWCFGYGRVASDDRCAVCRGTGSVMVGQPSRRCPGCRCTGRDDQGGRCEGCGGAGWLGVRGRQGRKPDAAPESESRYEALLDFMRRHK